MWGTEASRPWRNLPLVGVIITFILTFFVVSFSFKISVLVRSRVLLFSRSFYACRHCPHPYIHVTRWLFGFLLVSPKPGPPQITADGQTCLPTSSDQRHLSFEGPWKKLNLIPIKLSKLTWITRTALQGNLRYSTPSIDWWSVKWSRAEVNGITMWSI